MKREVLLAEARKHVWAAWQLSAEELASQAVATLHGLGMLVPEGGAQELEKLAERVVELEAELYTEQAHGRTLLEQRNAHAKELLKLRPRVAELEAAAQAIVHLHKDSPMGPCPVCIDGDAMVRGDDYTLPYPCPTARLAGAKDCDPPSQREEPCHPCGCPKRFDRHADGCPTRPEPQPEP